MKINHRFHHLVVILLAFVVLVFIYKFVVNSWLSAASEKPDVHTMKILISIGANVDARDNERTPLMYAVEKGNLKSVEALLDVGANSNAEYTDTGTTVLMAAVGEGYNDVAQALIEKGANVNAKRKGGKSVLWCAQDYPEAVRLLKKAGAIE